MHQPLSTFRAIISPHFDRTGYLKHVSSYYTEPPQSKPNLRKGQEGADSVDLTGKTVVVTGANSGLGKEVATYAASKGANLYMLCRSPDKAKVARDEIANLSDNDNIQVVLADLSERSQVRRAAAEIQASCGEEAIDCLVCNAGVLLNEQRNSSEGLEQTFASHLLGGTYLLTELLLPQLKKANGTGRVVVVTSGGMYNTALPSFDVMTSYTASGSAEKPSKFQYSGNLAYAYAKRGQVVLVEQWSKQHSDVKFVTVHPGWTDTPAVEEAYGEQKKYLEPMREPWQGAEGVAWLAAAAASELQSGELYLDRKVQKKHIAGPFMSEGTFTKNKPEEIQAFMEKLRETSGLDDK